MPASRRTDPPTCRTRASNHHPSATDGKSPRDARRASDAAFLAFVRRCRSDRRGHAARDFGGQSCAQDRAPVFEDPNGTRCLGARPLGRRRDRSGSAAGRAPRVPDTLTSVLEHASWLYVDCHHAPRTRRSVRASLPHQPLVPCRPSFQRTLLKGGGCIVDAALMSRDIGGRC